MSRIRRALGAMTMTAAAAGAGLLIAAAGAVPAHAAPATTAPPPGGHTVTITAQATAQATGKPGSAVLPCATVPGASCLPQTITCWINVPPPFAQMQIIVATTSVHCDSPVDAINLDQTLSEGSEIVEVKSDHPVGATDAFTIAGDGNCQGARVRQLRIRDHQLPSRVYPGVPAWVSPPPGKLRSPPQCLRPAWYPDHHLRNRPAAHATHAIPVNRAGQGHPASALLLAEPFQGV
jgi:hypothetical protein